MCLQVLDVESLRKLAGCHRLVFVGNLHDLEETTSRWMAMRFPRAAASNQRSRPMLAPESDLMPLMGSSGAQLRGCISIQLRSDYTAEIDVLVNRV